MLTTSPYFDNLEFDIFDTGSLQCWGPVTQHETFENKPTLKKKQ